MKVILCTCLKCGKKYQVQLSGYPIYGKHRNRDFCIDHNDCKLPLKIVIIRWVKNKWWRHCTKLGRSWGRTTEMYTKRLKDLNQECQVVLHQIPDVQPIKPMVGTIFTLKPKFYTNNQKDMEKE